MPLFEYHCTTCGKTVEILQRDASVQSTCGEDCPSGRGDGVLVRKMSAHAVLGGGAAFGGGGDACAGGMCPPGGGGGGCCGGGGCAH